MRNYDFTSLLSPIDFELLSKDLLEREMGIRLQNFREGKDKGVDLRYSQALQNLTTKDLAKSIARKTTTDTIVQCKRYGSFAGLKSELTNKELPKIKALNPLRYILTTSLSLSPQQTDDLAAVLRPFVVSADDIFGRERLNAILSKNEDIERRHIKLWAASCGLLNSVLHAKIHVVSREEVERTVAAAKIYVKNSSFEDALSILKKHRVCIISGMPGIGKTTLARMLLLYFYEHDFDIVKIESDISEARAVGYHNRPRFYFYDDFLGQTAHADKLNKNEDQKLLDFMASVNQSEASVFVLTTREYILNQARLYYERLDREKFDHRICIIDLSKYSRRIRAQILYNHLHFSDLLPAYRDNLLQTRSYLKIVDHPNYSPRLIEYLTSSAWLSGTAPNEYSSLFLKKLDNPRDIWDHAFRNQISPRAQHVLLVLTTLPIEVFLDDLLKAFEAFHRAECERFNLPSSPSDFNTALKELDGTFVATRQAYLGVGSSKTILVRFQNPSIRDFLQNLLIQDGDCLARLIPFLTFFEQGKWIANTLWNARLPDSRNADAVIGKTVDQMKALINAAGCMFFTTGTGNWVRVIKHSTYFTIRLTEIAEVSAKIQVGDRKWILDELNTVAVELEDGALSAVACCDSIEYFKEFGFLDGEVGKRFIAAVKCQALKEPIEIEDFEAIGRILNTIPESFSEIEVLQIEREFTGFADDYSSYDSNDPEELREAAEKLESVGNLVGVDTDSYRDFLNDRAKEIEKEEEEGREWEPDDDDHRGGSSDDCPDSDIESMFSTLG